MHNERVILIKGDGSKWYDQIIFILKNNVKINPPVDLVAEAEKIIGDYLNVKLNNKHVPIKSVQSQTKPIQSKPIINVVSKKKSSKPCSKPATTSNFDFFLNLFMLIGCLALVCILIWFIN